MLRVMGKQPGMEKGAKAPKKQRTGNPSPSSFSNADTAAQRAAMDLLQQRMRDGLAAKKLDVLPQEMEDHVFLTRGCKKFGGQLCKLARAGTVTARELEAARKTLSDARGLLRKTDLETPINKLKQMHKIFDELDETRTTVSKVIDATKKELNGKSKTAADAASKLTAMTAEVVAWEAGVAKKLKGKYVQKKQIGQLIGQRLPTLMHGLECCINEMLQRPVPELSDVSDAEHDEGVDGAVEEQGGELERGSPAGPHTPSATGEDLTAVKSAIPPVALPVDEHRVVTLVNGEIPTNEMALDDKAEEEDEE